MDGVVLMAMCQMKSWVTRKKCVPIYARAFMASGSVNNPETSRYHLEIFSIYEEHNNDICKMLNYYDLNARTLGRRNGYICYLKGAEKLPTFNINWCHELYVEI